MSASPLGSPKAPERKTLSSAERTYSFLLRAYPFAFRDEYGEAMMQFFRDQYRTGACDTLRFWSAVLLDVVRSAPALHADAWCARDRANGTLTPGGLMKTIATLTILIGAFGALNALAEAITGGYGSGGGAHSLAVSLGAVAGVLLIAAGATLLRRSPSARRTASAAAAASLVAVLIARFSFPWMSAFSAMLAVALPIVLLGALYWSDGNGSKPSTA